MVHRLTAVLAGPLIALGFSLANATALADPQTTCPPDPPPGSTVDGGLLVTGVCHLINVTVNGGVTVTGTGHLELERSTVHGGVTVQSGGELDSGHATPFTDINTGLPSTIDGGIDATNPFDLDLINATIHGGLSVNGSNPGSIPTVCESHIDGKVELSNITNPSPFPFLFGDPGEPTFAGTPADCPGNTIHGSLFVANSRAVEIEGNTISGSVHISDSTVEFAGNSFSSAHCQNVTPFTDGDGGIIDCTR